MAERDKKPAPSTSRSTINLQDSTVKRNAGIYEIFIFICNLWYKLLEFILFFILEGNMRELMTGHFEYPASSTKPRINKEGYEYYTKNQQTFDKLFGGEVDTDGESRPRGEVTKAVPKARGDSSRRMTHIAITEKNKRGQLSSWYNGV